MLVWESCQGPAARPRPVCWGLAASQGSHGAPALCPGLSCCSVCGMGFPTAPAPCRSAGSQEETRCWEEASCPRDGLAPWFRQQLSSWLTVPPGVLCVSAMPKQRLAAPSPGNHPVPISCVHPLTCPGCLRCYPCPPQQQKGSSQPSASEPPVECSMRLKTWASCSPRPACPRLAV